MLFLDQLVISVDGFHVQALVDALHRVIGHAQLFTLIDVRRTLHHVQACAEHFGAAHTAGFIAVASKTGHDAWLVVVVPK